MRQTPSRPRRPRGRNQRTGSAQPRPRRRRGRDLRHGHQHTQGAASRREDGRLQALQGPGERHRLELGRGHRGAVREAPRRLPGALRLARRDLRQVSPQGARRLHRRGHRHRMRRGRLEARPRRRRGGHRVLRLVAHLPADYPSARTRAAAVLEEAEPDALAYLDFPPAHWKPPTHQQRAGEDEQGDKAQVEGRAGVPVHGLAGAPGRRGHVRAGRGVAGVQVLLGGEDERALRRGVQARDRRTRRLETA